MKILDLTFSAPEENLACDDALLEMAEEGLQGEVLRFWEPEEHFAVLGYSNKAAAEINLGHCKNKKIPIFRRISGGGTVLQGPGCLNYSLVLNFKDRPELANIRSTNDFVMKKNCLAMQRLAGPEVQVKGISDLALGNLKFSGNAQRRKSRFALFHGTFLLKFDIAKIEKFLAMPSLQPDYRENRGHADFLANLDLKPADVKKGLMEAWGASESFEPALTDRIKKLIENHYSKDSWNFKF